MRLRPLPSGYTITEAYRSHNNTAGGYPVRDGWHLLRNGDWVEHSCNVELTSRQEKRLESLRKRANDMLRPYGLKLDNPWGLCCYACPIVSDDRLSESNCTFLA